MASYYLGSCVTCGATVTDEAAHDRWHFVLARALVLLNNADRCFAPSGDGRTCMGASGHVIAHEALAVSPEGDVSYLRWPQPEGI
jgi:hypothetical protein